MDLRAIEAQGIRPDEIASLDVFEIAGTIKWFDISKGYGFIVPDNGLPDVLLHVTCLRAGGYPTAYEGARVHAQVLR
ncbi:MAG TPA: cold shock domain-containing protein, partial [Hyphomicrobiaceae bacterium]|nr:cold shock domain-containing protein [Hyphomicrobiaceae bacterium]